MSKAYVVVSLCIFRFWENEPIKMRINLVFMLVITFSLNIYGNENTETDWEFPKDFIIGAATASYQIEGAWNSSGKGESVWDWFTHNRPNLIKDGTNGDVACDSFDKYKEDVSILKNIGFDFYRFSISWTRIFPTGFPNKISSEGIEYYKNLIDELRAKGLEPFVTIYHWDHPAVLEKLGGWTNELMVDWFASYARVVIQELGPKVKFFATLNEPMVFCPEGYGGLTKAPGLNLNLYAEYICMHNVLKAHAKVYHMYNDEFRQIQNGKIGIVNPCQYYYSKNETDTQTRDIAFDYSCGWASHPIFSKDGDYPPIMRQRIDENSKIQGWPTSRLPRFTQDEIKYIRGSSDFFGLNHYTSFVAIPQIKKEGSVWFNDAGYYKTFNPKWPGAASSWLKVVPEGFRHMLNKIKKEYQNPIVYVTENGYSDRDGLNDYGRMNYYYSYIKQMLLAIKDGCNVKGYAFWSLLDNFEWEKGYTERFGIIHVDFKDPKRKRSYKNSAKWFQNVLRIRKLLPINETYCNNV
ncbi:myrosinase 1-like isoform X1 [Leptopilina boulardi]|uniref:myrosinase 1-like isoform X1 n=2 Tax=Leptopilina boulardi TaxID=63433 RepID=UPI0021F5B423|nr:myrosinase 1-like isoform X1 [Leptopilina boulardi]